MIEDSTLIEIALLSKKFIEESIELGTIETGGFTHTVFRIFHDMWNSLFFWNLLGSFIGAYACRYHFDNVRASANAKLLTGTFFGCGLSALILKDYITIIHEKGVSVINPEISINAIFTEPLTSIEIFLILLSSGVCGLLSFYLIRSLFAILPKDNLAQISHSILKNGLTILKNQRQGFIKTIGVFLDNLSIDKNKIENKENKENKEDNKPLVSEDKEKIANKEKKDNQ